MNFSGTSCAGLLDKVLEQLVFNKNLTFENIGMETAHSVDNIVKK